MWSRNLVNTIQTVAQAVAPPVDSDDDEEYEEYTDDEAEEEELSSSQQAPSSGGRLGFVGLLTRAMDRQASDEEDEYSQEEAEEEEDVHEMGRPQLYAQYSSDEDNFPQVSLQEEPGSPPPQMMSPQKRESGSLHAGLLKATPEVLQQLHLLDTSDNDDDSTESLGNHDIIPDSQPSTTQVRVEEIKASVSVPAPSVENPVTKTNGVAHATAGTANPATNSAAEPLIKPASTTILKPMAEESDTRALPKLEKSVETALAPVKPTVSQPESNPTPPAKRFAQPPSIQNKSPSASPAVKALPSSPAAYKAALSTPPVPRPASSPTGTQQQQALEARCREFEQQLAQAQQELAIRNTSKADDLDVLAEEFRQQESKHLQRAQEAHQQELETITRQFETRIEQLEKDMRHEQKAFDKERRQMTAQLQNQADARRVQQEFSKVQEQLIQTMTLLDEREHQVLQLRQTIKNLEGQVQENKAAHMEDEDILEEVHQENDQLRNHVEQAEARCEVLKAKVEDLQHQQEKFAHVQLELRMLKEELERERAKSQNAVASASNNNQVLEEERDAALALVGDFKQQLAATSADLDIARADYERIIMSNNNLQAALESFQSEREAEIGMLEDQRREAEEALAAAHSATVEAIKGAHTEYVRQVQAAADAALKNSMKEIQHLEGQLKKYESENIQMRRSLDEAIHRLQMNQEDVIDRTLMKNILMDWLTKTGTKERKDILELMASVLHFTEEEKERVHISSSHIATSLLGKLAGPVPAPKADMENLKGDTVSEKWVSFLLAETED